MQNTAQKVLGQERIEEICRQHGLDDEDVQLVGKILSTDAWNTPDAFRQDMQVIRAAGDHPKYDQIFAAMMQIREELASSHKQ